MPAWRVEGLCVLVVNECVKPSAHEPRDEFLADDAIHLPAAALDGVAALDHHATINLCERVHIEHRVAARAGVARLLVEHHVAVLVGDGDREVHGGVKAVLGRPLLDLHDKSVPRLLGEVLDEASQIGLVDGNQT